MKNLFVGVFLLLGCGYVIWFQSYFNSSNPDAVSNGMIWTVGILCGIGGALLVWNAIKNYREHRIWRQRRW